MLRPSTLPSTDRLRFLPSDLYSVHSEYPNPQSFHKSSLLPITITRHHHLRILCRRSSSNDAVVGASQLEARFEEISVDGVEKEHTSMGIGSPSLFRPLVT
ncbi:hypothetical protein MA16_Dca008949 [Dendrobium catenatum]|uniref:Uncharacterized protein n=1 Tax=Dendrobium catenatum TaxID=906689 RepID=A0A2I0WRN3_9ASPA|nr:hypothetical protein MA16_Dca008949 [Dendrobium catenatum]